MKIQSISSFSGFGRKSVNNTINTKDIQTEKYFEPLTGTFYYYGVVTKKELSKDIFEKTTKVEPEKQQKVKDKSIMNYWEAIKW